eukprot:CAMPEP_0195306374 /NCGR_PEP_ID=MMETSP0707-20130614/37169_1 /TAXON_ID=33640 /ORGANISM="Asterionellopsis glacialis, Strain CCMP134" /LENGTH=286 /DNA_ID=CAMNT_0040370591 /DNA_START=522 /DNA_END=1379 /DNA_ORIENTATION=+
MTTTTKTKSGRSGGSGFTFQATIRTLVQTEMMDHHFIHADIYAATFDIFYPTTWKGTVLAHIGNVRDLSLMKQQQQQQQQQDETSSCEVRMMPQQEQSQEKTEQQRIDNETTSSSSSTLTEQGPSSSTSSQQQPQQPLWTLQPRQSLQINDDLRLTLLPSLFEQGPSSSTSSQQQPQQTQQQPQQPLWTLQPRQSLQINDDLRLTLLPSLFHSLSTLSHLLWSFVKSGTITIPTTGVAHVRAGFVPGGGTSVAMTIRLICENVLHVFQQMTLVGNKCFIHGVTTGW